MNIQDKLKNEISDILSDKIPFLASQFELLSQNKFEIKSDDVYYNIVSVIKKYKEMGLKPKEAEAIVQSLFDSEIYDNSSEIKTDILNDVLCAIVGFCSPHLRIWDVPREP